MSHQFLKARLRDVTFVVATPFSEDGDQVLTEHIKHNVKQIESVGGQTFLPCGNTGEYYSLTNQERIDVVESTVSALHDNCAVIGGAGGSASEVVDLANAYEAAGADGVMIMYPNHPYSHAQGVTEYYRKIADSVDCGVILYKRGPKLPQRVIKKLSNIENIIGVKYAVDDLVGLSNAIRNTPGDIVWVNGIAERYAVAYATAGTEGFTTGIGNFVPSEVLRLMEALQQEDWERAQDIQSYLQPLENLREETGVGNSIPSANNVPVVKYGMELADLHGGSVREPLVYLSEEDRRRVEDHYQQIKSERIVTGE